MLSNKSDFWSSVKRWGPRLLAAVAAIILLWQMSAGIILFFKHAWLAIKFPYPFDYGEGPILDQVARLAHFQNIYRRDISTPPYTITNYPPLYPLVQVVFYWIFGPHLWYGRLISLLSVLATAVFIGLTLYTITKNTIAAITGGLMLLVFPYILTWAPLTRVDSFALGLSWAGLYVLVSRGASRKGLITAALLLSAAIFTRQSYGLAAPLAGFVWLLSQKPRRRALLLAAWVAGIGLIAFLLLTLLSRGGFYFHIITANVNPFYWETVNRYRLDLTNNLLYLFVSSALFLLLGLLTRASSWWLVAPYLLGAVATAITIGKDGSNVNYLYELCAALSLTAGAIIAWPGKRRWYLSILLLLVLAPQVNRMAKWSEKDFYSINMVKTIYTKDLSRMSELIQKANGSILADEYMGILPQAGKPIVYQPFEFKMLAEAGLWDSKPFIEAIKNKQYAMILLYDPPTWNSPKARWTQPMLDAIDQAYQRQGGRQAYTIILVPKR
jgi:hypothetical protein